MQLGDGKRVSFMFQSQTLAWVPFRLWIDWRVIELVCLNWNYPKSFCNHENLDAYYVKTSEQNYPGKILTQAAFLHLIFGKNYIRQSSLQNFRVKNAWSLTETSGKKGYFEIITQAEFVSVCVQTAKAPVIELCYRAFDRTLSQHRTERENKFQFTLAIWYTWAFAFPNILLDQPGVLISSTHFNDRSKIGKTMEKITQITKTPKLIFSSIRKLKLDET